MVTRKQITRADFSSPEEPTWCKGCGNYGVLNAIKMALAEQGIAPHQVVIIYRHRLRQQAAALYDGERPSHSARPAAAGGHRRPAGQPRTCTILTVHGDGDGYGMGLGHFAHAARRNIGIVDVIQNNRVYGLTRGQYSPTSDRACARRPRRRARSTGRFRRWPWPSPWGRPLSPAAMPASCATWSGFLGEALQHTGYALVDVLQPCVTFNRPSAYDFYNPRVYKLEETDHDVTDRAAAWERAMEWGDRHPDRDRLSHRGHALVRGAARADGAAGAPLGRADCSVERRNDVESTPPSIPPRALTGGEVSRPLRQKHGGRCHVLLPRAVYGGD